jgi:hypothetical protein
MANYHIMKENGANTEGFGPVFQNLEHTYQSMYMPGFIFTVK